MPENYLLVLIDESGCAGFKLGKGSTKFFIIGMVIFTDTKMAEKTSRCIEEMKKELNIKPEFKFNKTDFKKRDIFFQKISFFDFKVRALVVEKEKIYSKKLRTEKNSFYNYFLKMLLHYDGEILSNASIKIDGSGDTVFKRELTSYLRRQLEHNKIKKFKFVESKGDNLVQLADMVVGAIARFYRADKKDSDRWLNVLKKANRIDDIWDFK